MNDRTPRPAAILPTHVRHERTGVAHAIGCPTLERVLLARVRAIHPQELSDDVPLCSHCLVPRPRARRRPPKAVTTCSAGRLVGLRRFRYNRCDIGPGDRFEAVNSRDADILVRAKLARPGR